MGIPSYFSYIIKNHKYIISKINTEYQINNFYIDSNSIIYDMIRTNEYDENKYESLLSYQNFILDLICKELDDLIKKIKPTKNVYIAFDGIAPVAKLEQQRTRRFKSLYTDMITKQINPNHKKSFDTTMITPGTPFMKNLDNKVQQYFTNKYNILQGNSSANSNGLSSSNGLNVIVSASDEVGEGEHKIYQYIRDNPNEHLGKNTIIYGLDADLIMLSLNHLRFCDNIYLYREAPEFIKSIDPDLEPNETYLLNIKELSIHLHKELSPILEEQSNVDIGEKYRNEKMFDYIFICFMLGNDFLPHFPSINIRTNGIDILIETYRETFSADEYIFDGVNIKWSNLRKLILKLSEREEEYAIDNFNRRIKIEKRRIANNTIDDKMYKFTSMPTKDLTVEKYINPGTPYWNHRYYQMLFGMDEVKDDRVKQICINYLEGLQWTMMYYTTGCMDWRWCYKYDYPPLLRDLIKYTPYFDTEFITKKPANPVTNNTQLAYVLPKPSLYYLPTEIHIKIKDMPWYIDVNDEAKFKWAFCKYFWECHPQLPHIDIDMLSGIVDS